VSIEPQLPSMRSIKLAEFFLKKLSILLAEKLKGDGARKLANLTWRNSASNFSKIYLPH
jgi:hypothetical protein